MTRPQPVNARIERFLASIERRYAGERHEAAAVMQAAFRGNGALVLA
jgi:hypothetical protein